MASYVVSLLRPEIIRDLDLPEHGLDILPLDGTFTPLPEGAGCGDRGPDYLWRVNDHGQTVRELRRWSASDAEAYEEYGRLMVEMARFIKPILGIVPPDSTALDPATRCRSAGLARDFRRLPELQQAVFVQLMTMSAADFLDQWFETDPLKATMSRVGDHRHVPGHPLAGHGLRAAAPLHGRDRRRVPRLGHPAGGTGGISNADRVARPALRRRDPHEAPVARDPDSGTAGRPASSSTTARRSAPPAVLSLGRCQVTFLDLLEPGTLEPAFEAEVRRFRFRGSSGKVNLALDGLPDFTLPARARRAPARRRSRSRPSMDYMERAYDDAKAGHFEPPAVHRHRSSRRSSTRRWRRRAST